MQKLKFNSTTKFLFFGAIEKRFQITPIGNVFLGGEEKLFQLFPLSVQKRNGKHIKLKAFPCYHGTYPNAVLDPLGYLSVKHSTADNHSYNENPSFLALPDC